MASELNTKDSRLQESKNWQSVWLDYGYYLLALPLLCCLYFFRRGILVVAFLLATYPAQASFFQNANQDGLEAFNKQDFQRASEHFKDTRWKAASRYRMGDYEQAYRDFAKGNDVTSLYNQGNALAKGGKIEEAIKKYEDVLAQDANHEDAKFNLEYLKRQQNQQQQNQQQQNNNNENSNNDEPQDSSGSNDGDNQGDNEENNNQDSSGNDKQDNNQSGDDNEQNDQPDASSQDNSQGDEKQSDGQQQQSGDDDRQSGSQGGMNEQPSGGDEKEDEQPQDQPENGGQNGDNDDEKFDEQGQARAQQYREIPEDPGGLLKAFIHKEYSRNRYNEK